MKNFRMPRSAIIIVAAIAVAAPAMMNLSQIASAAKSIYSTIFTPPQTLTRAGSGFRCDNSKGVKMYGNYSHDNAGEGFGVHKCDDADITGNISEHNGFPPDKK